MDTALENLSGKFGTERILASGAIAAMAGAAGVARYFDPEKVSFLPVCPLLKMTGFACPGCGLTRGFHALLHGDVVTALDFNALLPLYGLLFGYFFISLVLVVRRGRGLPIDLLRPAMLWTFLGIAVVFTVLRNLPYYPFNALYP